MTTIIDSDKKLFQPETRAKLQKGLQTATLVLGGLSLLAYTANTLLDENTSAVIKSVFKVFAGAVGEAATTPPAAAPATDVNINIG